ncbi:hypothetical protein JQN72_02570 [Phycicoccus sp. CSK15P-2]|uniref:hypothetical protein n=1 Tax=Phycicoccus sp. CSK15P-2 TaxID=2807627 RepID=UPI0019518FF8|nr:hypothetical protein [Phycicoccus sp. CSK15P-2]MBM6403131.1 hypothetical protein [Phycicoccus sp. CSK15P-2]
MAVIDDLRKTVDTTPLYAIAGVTDLAVEKVRGAQKRAETRSAEITKRAEAARADLSPSAVQARAERLAEQVKDLPALALNQGLVVSGRVTEGYEAFATRGKDVVGRIRTQKSTQDLVAQAGTTVAQAKGAVTTARHAAAEIERSAKATLTTGRKEAAKVATVLTDSVAEEAKEAQVEVAASAKRTRAAAKRTSTTSKKGTKRTTASTKAAGTSARKTAKASTKAAEKAAEKVGD